MWDVFALGVVVEAVFAFVPGAILLAALRFDRVISLACAPLVTVFYATAVALVFERVGVACSWTTVLAPLAVVAIAAAVASALVCRARAAGGARCRAGGSPFGGGQVARSLRRAQMARLVVAVCAGVAAGLFVFVGNLPDAASFSQEYDNVHHLGEIRAFAETGNWSPFAGTMYPGEDAYLDPAPGGGFYPSAWHQFAAFAVSALGISVPVAANATTFLFGFIVYPVAVWALLEKAFAGKPAAIVLGSCAAVAFGAFPYGLITFGPLYPNLMSFAMIPAAAAAFLALFVPDATRGRRVLGAALFVVGLGALVFAQPNGVFSLGVLLLFFCAQQAARAGGAWYARRSGGDGAHVSDPANAVGVRKRLAGVKFAIAVGFLVLAALVWIALFAAPFMRSVVTHMWASFATVPQAILNVLMVSYTQFAPSLLLGSLIIVGAIYTLYRRQYVWITCSYVFASGIYFVCAVSNGLLKSLTSGFWYTDANRLAATLAIIAVPLAALGLYVVYRGVVAGLTALARRLGTGARAPRYAIAPLVAVFLAAALCPSFDYAWNGTVVTQMGSVAQVVEAQNGGDALQIYEKDEQAFVEDVLEVLPDDAVVLNSPNDGSGFAYCADGLNVAFRYLRDFDVPTESEASKTIRLGLADIATNADVADAVEGLGAEWVLLLDQGNSDPNHYLFSYQPEQWSGIDSVRDDTPGFTVVLAEGDMRLYHIDA